MTEKLIIASFGIATVGIHWLIYKWVKFKIDEGTITNHFQEKAKGQALSVEQISDRTNIKLSRVGEICVKSKSLALYQDSRHLWCIGGQTG